MPNRIDLALAPSTLAGLIAALPWCVLALAALALGWIQHPLLWVFCPLAIVGGLCQFRTSGWLQRASSVCQLSVTAGGLCVHLKNGRRTTVRIAADSRLFARLAILKLTPVDTTVKPALVILVDPGFGLPANVDPVAFRRLRVWLRLGLTEPAAGQGAVSP